MKPEIEIESGPPLIAEPYLCIATQATSQNKYWNNAGGWTEIVTFLKAHGYRVICIDQKPIEAKGAVTNQIPYGAEDQTGDRPLTERARWLRHAAFFVGLSSGLSWLAWAAGCPVVMISGFTHPMNEFHTPYRISNMNVCNSCSNDVRLQLDPTDFLFCPRHKNTARMFECTRLISAEQVKVTIRTIPGFGLSGQFQSPRSRFRLDVADPADATETSSTVSRTAIGNEHQNLGMVTLRVPADDRAVYHGPITVVVSGIGRSGTSMIAKVLHALGLPMGKTDGLEVFEDQEFVKALVSFDYNHVRQIISAHEAEHARWGFKFASLQNHLFPPQLAHFRNPRLIVISRDPIAAASRSHVSDPDRKDIEETLLNVAGQMSDMVTFVRGAECPTLLVSYEKFIAFPDQAIDALARFCGIVVTDKTRARARHAVEPNNPDYIKLFHPSYCGNFDAVKDSVAIGWCAENGCDDPVPVELLADGLVVTSAVADIFRQDLLEAGIGTGCHGFRLDVACLAGKPDAVLQIRTVRGGYLIFNSGRTLKEMAVT